MRSGEPAKCSCHNAADREGFVAGGVRSFTDVHASEALEYCSRVLRFCACFGLIPKGEGVRGEFCKMGSSCW